MKRFTICLILFWTSVLVNSVDESNEDRDNEIVESLEKNGLLQGRSELVFLLDRSGSVGSANFEIQKGFVESLLTHVVVNANATRVSVISYSDTAERHIDYIKEPKTKCFLSQELQFVTYRDSRATNIAAALEEARLVLKNARPNVNKVVILISDGLATVGKDQVKVAKKLREESGAQIFTFGIGRFLKSELLALASSGRHMYSCLEFKDFKRLARKIRGDPHETSWSGEATTPNCDHLCNSLYKGEPNDPGCCDHFAKCSCALLSGLHTCVCGPGYYGLSGTHGKCRSCPRGTYKSRLEPSSSCTLCPAGSTTAEEASTSIRDCYCKDGYVGNPSSGKPCIRVQCPPLQEPKNGYIVGDCQREYGSACHFMCEEGYELIDPLSDIRMCESNGKWSQSLSICRRIQCQDLPAPRYGMKRCDQGILTVGKVCNFSCPLGFILKGSQRRQCLPSKNWSGKRTECLTIKCPVPKALEHDTIINCRSDEKPEFMQTCYFRCNNGYRLEGPEYLYCSWNGKLLDNYGKASAPFCEDIQKPEIFCPQPIVKYSLPHKNFAYVKWKTPLATDNSGILPEVKSKPPGITSPQKFLVGTTNIIYKATDSSGLYSYCEFTVTVYDAEPPLVIKCPPKIEIDTPDLYVPVFWDEPIFKDNSDPNLKITKSSTPGDVFEIGNRIVTYTARDRHGNEAQCQFEVIVTQTYCPYYPPPTNGAFACDDWTYGQFCQAYCNEKFDFVTKPAEWYICSSDAKWETLPQGLQVPWPNCARKAHPQSINHMLRGFYYSGDCNDPRVQDMIREAFVKHFISAFNRTTDLCASEGACTLEMVNVICGASEDSEFPSHRFRRDVRQQEKKIEIVLQIVFHENGEELLDSKLENFLYEINHFNWNVNQELNRILSSNYTKNDSSFNHSVATDEMIEVVSGKSVVICQPGSILKENECVFCSMGTYYDNVTKSCINCPKGQYQDSEGDLMCRPCFAGASTESEQSKSITDCKRICTPGTYSLSGLETCIACPLGTFQNESGQNDCHSCPSGTTTPTEGSSGIQDCQSPCDLGSFSETGSQPCAPCRIGFYQSLPGQHECLECPSNLTTLSSGSKFRNNCIDFNVCQGNKKFCKNGGVCFLNDQKEVSCHCAPGYTGTFCETDINECLSEPCLNLGICHNLNGSFKCVCTSGFQGTFCEEEINECDVKPCLNGGTCLDEISGFLCVCSVGYEGLLCEKKSDFCGNEITCLNAGICKAKENGNDSFCHCLPGYAGVDCSVDINDCENISCHNGGSCIDELNSFHCHCEEGFTGAHCEIEIDECQNNSCSEGSTCQDLIGRFSCICPPGWSGSECETKLNSDFILTFPDESSDLSNMASVSLNTNLSEITVSLWVQANSSSLRSGTLLSYALHAATSDFNKSYTEEKNSVIDNAFTLSDASEITVYINNKPLVTDIQLMDGHWHHLVFTWSSVPAGLWNIYKDGKLKDSGQRFQSNSSISGKGILIIGQEQDEVGGLFSPLESFVGNISRVNIWDKYFPPENVSHLYNFEDETNGRIVAWPDFLSGIEGNVKIINQKPFIAEP